MLSQIVCFMFLARQCLPKIAKNCQGKINQINQQKGENNQMGGAHEARASI